MNNIIKQINALESEAATIAENIRIGTQALRDKQTALTKQANELRAQVIKEMQESGVVKDRTEDFVLTLRKGSESVDVESEDSVPDEFIRLKREVDKAKIKAVRPAGNFYVIRRGEDTLTIKGIVKPQDLN